MNKKINVSYPDSAEFSITLFGLDDAYSRDYNFGSRLIKLLLDKACLGMPFFL